ncbi:MAG: substrate-binding domain-containing protein [Verrucomicrobia bacterium]|nr:substrate-binding domain-containing protein [Verrucomicrobiota bacterium]
MGEVEEVAAEAQGQRRPIRVGAGELVIREVLVRWLGSQRKEAAAISWVIRNLTSGQIQRELAAEHLDVGLASGLAETDMVRVKELASYGMKLVLPEKGKPDKSGWQRLAAARVVVLEGDGGFRRFLADCEREHGVKFNIGAECTSYPQAVDLAEAAGWAVFVPELWWRRCKEWAARTQPLPGLDEYRHTLQLGWNKRVSKRRPEVERLVRELGRERK